VLHIASKGLSGASLENPDIVSAVNIHDGAITHPAVAETFGFECRPFVP
jgi:alanine dehydrogenase